MSGPPGHIEGLGETLIPAINRLQDIFSQVSALYAGYAQPESSCIDARVR